MPHRPPVQCLWLALLSALAILAWQEFVIHYQYGGLQSGLFCTGAKFMVPPPLQPGTYLVPDSYGYDGQFYRYVAHDPFFRRGFATYMDDARHRYGRILLPLIAWTLSAGQDRWIDRAYQFTVVAFCALGVYWTCAWLSLAGAAPLWGAAAFLLLPATLTSIDRLLIDGPLCALFAGSLYYIRTGRWKAVYVIAVLAPLVRDTGILILAGLMAAALLERRWRHIGEFATAAIPALLWTRFVRERTSPSTALSIIEKPVTGLFRALLHVRHDYATLSKSLYVVAQTIDFLALTGYILCLALAAKFLWDHRKQWRDPVHLTVAAFLLLGLALGNPTHLQSAYGYARPLSPLILWVALIALASRKWLALIPPVMVTAGVAMYVASSTLRAVVMLVGPVVR